MIQFLKKMAVLFAFVFTVQGCALYVSDEDEFHHAHHEHHEHWRHEHSSLQSTQFAKQTDGNETTANKNSMDSEHQKKASISQENF